MAIKWGGAITTYTNGVRVGYEITQSPSRVSSGTSSVTLTAKVYLQTRRRAYGSASWSMGRDWSSSGTINFNHPNNSTNWPSNNITLMATRSITVSTKYEQRVRSRLSAYVSGVSVVSGTASVTRDWYTAARPISAPPSPLYLNVSRVTERSTRLSWTNPASTPAHPRERQQLRRRYWDYDHWTPWVTRANLSRNTGSYTDQHGTNFLAQYAIRASNSAGHSSFIYSDEIANTPAAPSNVKARKTAGGIHISWEIRSRFPAWTRVARQENGGAWTDLTRRGSGWEEADYNDPDLAVTHRFRLRAESQTDPFMKSEWAYTNTILLAAPPNAPSGLGPSGAWDATEPHVFRWTHSPTDGSDQEAFQLLHRLKGAGTWEDAGKVDSGSEQWELPESTYVNGDTVEWLVRTWGAHGDPGPYSSVDSTGTSARPVATIVVPDGSTVDRSTVLVEVAYEQGEESPQAGWRWRLDTADGETVRSEAGSGPLTEFPIPGLEDGETYTLIFASRSGRGLWSYDDSVTFDVVYVPPQVPDVTVTWDIELGAAVVQVDTPEWDEDFAEPSFIQIWRAIDDGGFLLIADEIPLGTSVSDPIPAIGDGTVNYYRVTTVSVLPSKSDTIPVSFVVSTDMVDGWVYLNAGPAMGTVCKIKDNVTRDDSEGQDKTLRTYAGRPNPVEYSGTERSLTWSITAQLEPNPDGQSSRGEIVALQAMPAPVCYRDPLGARWFGSMGKPDFSWQRIEGQMSFSMTRVDYTEGLRGGLD